MTIFGLYDDSLSLLLASGDWGILECTVKGIGRGV